MDPLSQGNHSQNYRVFTSAENAENAENAEKSTFMGISAENAENHIFLSAGDAQC